MSRIRSIYYAIIWGGGGAANLDNGLREMIFLGCVMSLSVFRWVMTKYLNGMSHYGGLTDSVTANVAKRSGRVLQSIFETRTVIDDCWIHVTGGIMSSSEIWIHISAKTIKKLDKVQNLFYRVLLQVPTGFSITAMY